MLDALMPSLRALQTLASRHGIRDIFQDNGGKYLQIALATGITLIRSREGNDAIDEHGREMELKTANADLVTSFTTHHHLNPTILQKYRSVDWLFAIFGGIELKAIYHMKPEALEPFFAAWEAKWHASGGQDINNPKIPIKFVLQNGNLVLETPFPLAPEEIALPQQDATPPNS